MVCDVAQRSPEWHRLRKGLVTASDAYLLETNLPALRRKWIRTQLGMGFKGNAATEYGTEAEPLAADWAAEAYGWDLREVGFVLGEEGGVGCSPDRLIVEADGETLLEIKCPYSRDIPTAPEPAHVAQVQFQMGVTGIPATFLLYWAPDQSPAVFLIKFDGDRWARTLELVTEFFTGLPPEDKWQEALGGDRSDAAWEAATSAWLDAQDALKAAQAAEESARVDLLALSDGKSTGGCGVRLSWVERKGNVDWKRIAKAHAIPEDEIEAARGRPSRYAKLEAL
jgi:hypothetical protein